MSGAAYGGLWVEHATPGDVHLALAPIARAGVALHLAWRADAPDDEAKLALARHADALGVELRVWPLVEPAHGYWAGALNAARFRAGAMAVLDAWERAGVRPAWLVVDLEPPWDDAAALDRALRARRLDADALARLRPIRSSEYDDAAREYEALVADCHRRGVRVLATTLPFVVDAAGPARRAVERALGVVVEPVPWDRVTLQVYRTLFETLLPAALVSPALVRGYARSARHVFGADRAGLDLGLVGGGVVPARAYEGPHDLALDLAAARSEGIPAAHLHVFGLDAMLQRAPLGPWLAPPHATEPRARPSSVRMALAAAARVAALVDALVHRGR